MEKERYIPAPLWWKGDKDMTNNNIFNYKELKHLASNIIIDNLKTRSLSSIARQCHISRPTIYGLLNDSRLTSAQTLLNIILNLK